MSEKEKSAFSESCPHSPEDNEKYEKYNKQSKNSNNHGNQQDQIKTNDASCHQNTNSARDARIIGTLRTLAPFASRAIPGGNSYCVGGTSTLMSPAQIDAVATQIHNNPATKRLKVTKQGFNTIQEMSDFILKNEKDNYEKVNRRLAAVEIDNDANSQNSHNNNFKYTLRMSNTERNRKLAYARKFKEDYDLQKARAPGGYYRTAMAKMPFQVQIPRMFPETLELSCGGNLPNYYKEGFAMVQDSLDSSFMNFKLNSANTVNDASIRNWRTIYSRFPYGRYSLDIFPMVLQYFCSTLTALGTLSLVLSAVRAIVDEKETRIKEYVKIMGATNSMQWFSWSLHYLLICFLISLIFTFTYTDRNLAVLFFNNIWSMDDAEINNNQTLWDEYSNAVNAVLPRSNPVCIFITIFINFFQMCWFSFFMSTFFSSSSNAAGIVGMLHFLSGNLFNTLSASYGEIALIDKVISCCFPTLSLGHIWWLIASYEGSGVGLTWSSIYDKFSTDKDFSIFELWFIMLGYIGFYMLMTVYVEAVRPGEFGVAKPWHFPFTFWMKSKDGDQNSQDRANNNSRKLICFEKLTEKQQNKVKVNIQNLRKEFTTLGGLKVAVDDLNLEICHGEIHALLGHNGAGKTTLVNMLTGMFTPTDGTASVNGYDIRTDIFGVRKSLGLCPQFNILFPNLTIEEHLRFFAGMKGTPSNKIQEEVDSTLKILRFEEYRNNLPDELSGGWKRRLSVAIAVIGDSEVVILDEPTSGMDPSTRRILWAILKEIKDTRTIVLSTHFMDEADILGDRVSIMSDGKLQASGSSNFLKNHFGCGYHILFSSIDDEFSKYNSDLIVKTVKHYVPETKVDRCIGQELNVVLPFDSVEQFPTLFTRLDKEKNDLGILSYGVMLTSMDEVFLKCTAEAKSSTGVNIYNAGEEGVGDVNFKLDYPKKEGISLEFNRLRACLLKNVLVWIRDKWSAIVQIGLGMLFVFGIIEGKKLTQSYRNPRAQPAMDLLGKVWKDQYDYKQSIPYWSDSSSSSALSTDNVTKFNEAVQSMAIGNNDYWNLEHYSNSHNSSAFVDEMVDTFNGIGPTKFDMRYFAGVGFSKGSGTSLSLYALGAINTLYLHFNGQHYHPAAQAQNFATNVKYRYLQKEDNSAISDNDLGTITTINQPWELNATERQWLTEREAAGVGDSKLYFDLGFILAMFLAINCKNKVNERVQKSKHTQFLTGIWNPTYWFSFYLVDLIFLALIVLPVPLTVLILGDDVFGQGYRWLYLYLYCFLVMLAGLPQFYVLQKFFSTPSVCIIVLMMAMYIIPSFFNIYVSIYMQINAGSQINDTITGQLRDYEASDVDNHDLMNQVWPHYTFFNIIDRHYANNASLYGCTLNQENEAACVEANTTWTENYLDYSDNGTGNLINFFFLQLVLWSACLLIFEFIETYVDRDVFYKYVSQLAVAFIINLVSFYTAITWLVLFCLWQGVKWLVELIKDRMGKSSNKVRFRDVSIAFVTISDRALMYREFVTFLLNKYLPLSRSASEATANNSKKTTTSSKKEPES